MTKPFITGVASTRLTEEERAFLAAERPVGLIIFARNIETPDQIRALTRAFREAVDDPDALVLIDQEGGRVARLTPPTWRAAPEMAAFGRLYDRDPATAKEALALNCRLLAEDLLELGISVDCVPVLDLQVPGADTIIATRAFHADPDVVAALGQVAVDAFLASGVLPVIKHIPGHGRARVDSHTALPHIGTAASQLQATDFVPFKALADAPAAMTAHICYDAYDAAQCATLSARVTTDVIRGWIGFDGLLMTDDLSMGALDGPMGQRCAAALAAGCDLLLHCNGRMDEMRAVAAACPDTLPPQTQARLDRARAALAQPAGGGAPADAAARLAALLA
ncbi:MAG: beta-N-acetylhexosaminidase [Rhodothalassiaceae bacterium]